MAAKRRWREVPRAERARIAEAVFRGRASSDPRDSANAAGYAEWLLERTTLPRWVELGGLVFQVGMAVVLAVLFWPTAWDPFFAGAYLALALYSHWSRRRRRLRQLAARDANRALAQTFGSVADIEFPQRDPDKLSPWRIRPKFALGVTAVLVLLPATVFVVSVAAAHFEGRPHVGAVNAACTREHEALRALKAVPMDDAARDERLAAIEGQLIDDIEASVPVAERSRALGSMLAYQNERMNALEAMADALRANDRATVFAAQRNLQFAEDRFFGAARVFGASACRPA
jgi:hypothetical protein